MPERSERRRHLAAYLGPARATVLILMPTTLVSPWHLEPLEPLGLLLTRPQALSRHPDTTRSQVKVLSQRHSSSNSEPPPPRHSRRNQGPPNRQLPPNSLDTDLLRRRHQLDHSSPVLSPGPTARHTHHGRPHQQLRRSRRKTAPRSLLEHRPSKPGRRHHILLRHLAHLPRRGRHLFLERLLRPHLLAATHPGRSLSLVCLGRLSA